LQFKNSTGWGTGANSKDVLDGDIHVVWQVKPGTLGAAVGFRDASKRSMPVNPLLFEHGVIYSADEFGAIATVIENGVQGGGFALTGAETFEIRRHSNNVYYLIGKKVIYSSLNQSYGTKLVMGCLYATGDVIL
jgi:hypothetical protein